MDVDRGNRMFMSTDRFAEFLAKGAGEAPRHIVARRLSPGLILGLTSSAGLALLLIGPLPATVFTTWAPWIKLFYVACLVVIAMMLTASLARPVSRTTWPLCCALLAFGSMLVWGSLQFLEAGQSDRSAILFGQTWLICPWMVLGLSVPAFVALLWALRGLAPTRLTQAGAAVGFLAGSVGALGYSLVCPESSVLFVAVWYSLGIVLSTIVGALIGPRFIRW